MSDFDRKKHWEKIYEEKCIDEVGWFQSIPLTSLDFLKEVNLPKTAKIIDVGAGDSYFVDHLLDLGYTDVTVLDISAKAIDRAKQRLGDRAMAVKWIEADIAQFQPSSTYDLWHDRASFHFLCEEQEIENYIIMMSEHVSPGGFFVIGTFSEQGPLKCSGIDIKQYSEDSIHKLLGNNFEKLKCLNLDHITPSGAAQNYTFCSFTRSINV